MDSPCMQVAELKWSDVPTHAPKTSHVLLCSSTLAPCIHELSEGQPARFVVS